MSKNLINKKKLYYKKSKVFYNKNKNTNKPYQYCNK